jgi:enoyl-[acyl-carrier protein] reductase I
LTAFVLRSRRLVGVTGEIHFVDSGCNVISMPQPDALKAAGGAVENGGQ